MLGGWSALSTRDFIAVALASVIICGCAGSHSALTPPGRQPVAFSTPNVDPNNYEVVALTGKPTTANRSIPVAHYFRRKISSLPAKRKVLDLIEPYATILIQPGDSCGANPPSWSPGQACLGLSYASANIDSSCGEISWSVDTSQLPSDVTLSLAPTTTAISDITAFFVNAPTTEPVGKYNFVVSGTCTNPNHQGAYPGPGTFSLAIVKTDLVDKTQSPAATITAPGTLHDQVGAEESVYAQVTPSEVQPYMNTISWSMPYQTSDLNSSFVDGYSQSTTSASYSAITTTDNNPIHFFPIAPQNGPGVMTITAQSGSAGTAFHASTGLIVDSPTVAVTASGGAVNVGTIPAASVPVLIAGWTNQNLYSGDGVEWSATFTSPSGYVHGQAGMTQLAGVNIWSQPSPAPGMSAPDEQTQTTYGYDLDSAVQFGQVNLDESAGPSTATLTANSSALWRSADDPDALLLGCLDGVQVEEFFKDYFNFTPDPKPNYSSITVTVGYLEWYWGAYANRPDYQTDNTAADWGDPGVWWAPSPAAVSPSTELPTWGARAQDVLGGPPC